MILSGFAELITLASIIPFLNFLTSGINSTSSNNHLYLSKLLYNLHLSDTPQSLAIASTFLFALVIIVASLIRLLNFWFNHRLSALIGTDLGLKAFNNIIYQPYTFHINENSSKIITAVSSHISSIVSLIDNSLLFVTSSFVSISLIVGILILEFKLALFAIIVFLACYLCLYVFTRNTVTDNGRIIATNKNLLVKFVQESLGSIREILLAQNQHLYLNIFDTIDSSIRLKVANNAFLAIFPRFILESFGLIVLASAGTFLLLSNDGNENVLLQIGTLAVAAQRLLPALQQMYSQLTNIRGLLPASNFALKFLHLKVPTSIDQLDSSYNSQPFTKKLEFINVSYSYSTKNLVLDNLNFQIVPGQSIGIIGTTGSGKSTLIDLLMTLLEPSSGLITLDDVPLSWDQNPSLVSKWRTSISHVPQHIFLTDSSLAQNIAFGIRPKDIDQSKLRSCAQVAQISSFIDSLPSGYETSVGERGVKLSGGQLQRIGIARALYSSPTTLILDEATSALDPSTESLVMRSIKEFSSSITVIMISHRLHSLTTCDFVIDLKAGKIKSFYDQATFSKSFIC